MFLADIEIRTALLRGLVIEGMSPNAIGPASVDLMLSPHFWVFDDHLAAGGNRPGIDIDPREDQAEVGREVEAKEHLVLHPGEVVLGSTIERFVFPATLGGRLEGKSSLGRLGLMTHVTAGFFDPGFIGFPTLEIVNLRRRPIRLYPGMPIAQMSIFRMGQQVAMPYDQRPNSKYTNQAAKPAPSQYHRNFPLSTCPSVKDFVNVSPPHDVAKFSCDHVVGHGGPHHDPNRDVEWHRS